MTQKKKGGVGVLTVGNLAAQGTRLVSSVVIAQVLGPAGRGAVALISVLDEVSSATFTAGVPVAAGYHAKLGIDSDQELLNASLLAGILVSPVALAVAALVAYFALGDLTAGPRWMAALLIAWTGVVNLPSMAAMNVLQAHHELKRLAIYRAAFGVASMALIAVIAVFGDLTVFWVAVSFAVGRVVTAVFGLAVTRWPRLMRRGNASLKDLFRYGIKAVPGAIGMLLNNKLDQLLIAPFVSLSDLGLYAVAAGTSFAPATLGMSMGASAFATVTHDTHLGRKASAATAIRHGLVVSAFASALLAAVTPVVIPFVYGTAFSGAVVPTLILLAGSIPWGGQLVATQCANALGKPAYASISESVGLLLTIGALLVFVPTYGINAAAIISSCAYSLRLGVTLILLRQLGVRHVFPGWDDVIWLRRRLVSRVRDLAHSQI